MLISKSYKIFSSSSSRIISPAMFSMNWTAPTSHYGALRGTYEGTADLLYIPTNSLFSKRFQ